MAVGSWLSRNEELFSCWFGLVRKGGGRKREWKIQSVERRRGGKCSHDKKEMVNIHFGGKKRGEMCVKVMGDGRAKRRSEDKNTEYSQSERQHNANED